jgi:hypothetical protein
VESGITSPGARVYSTAGDGGGAHAIVEVLVVADDVQEVLDVLLERREPPLGDVFEVVAAPWCEAGESTQLCRRVRRSLKIRGPLRG